MKIGEPIFNENLSVAIDKAGPTHAALLFEIDRIIGEMHEDGTLTALSEEWFEADLTPGSGRRLTDRRPHRPRAGTRKGPRPAVWR